MGGPPRKRFLSTTHLLVVVFLLSLLVNVSGITLRIVPASKTLQQTKIAANFPFDPKLEIEILDASSNRITTGADSSLTVTPVVPGTVCLSVDSSFQLQNGVGVFAGSICEVIDNVNITFTVTASSGALTSDVTKNFDVSGEIHLAYLHKENFGFDGQLERNVLDRIEDINEGLFRDSYSKVFSDRTVVLQSYYYPTMFADEAIKTYNQMRNYHQSNPEKKAFALIGFENNYISRSLLPLTVVDDYSVLSFRDDTASEFSDKTKYPNFNRISYSEDTALNGLMLYLLERKWTKIIVINGQLSKFTSDFYTLAATRGVEIINEFIINDIEDANTEPVGRYETMFNSIKSAGINIVVNNVKNKQTGDYLYTEAVRTNVTLSDGYTWVGYKNYEEFPFENYPLGCHKSASELCILRFHRMEFIEPTYLVEGWRSREWDHVWNKGFRADFEKTFRGFDYNDLTWKGAIVGLANDAVSTYILAIERIIKANKTISGSSLALDIRTNTNFKALTGADNLVVDSITGTRQNLDIESKFIYARIEEFNRAKKNKVDQGIWDWWNWDGTLHRSSNTFFTIKDALTTQSEVIERKSNGLTYIRWVRSNINDISLAHGYSQFYPNHLKNNRTFKSYNGIFHYEKQIQGEITWSYVAEPVPVAQEVITRTELVPPTHYCPNGCGGNAIDITDVNKYEHGECIKQDTCMCIKSNGTELWKGASCNVAVCSACSQFGTCVSPGNCVCRAGYSGADCASPICASCSSGGVCVTPGNCRCNAGQYGPACESECTCVNGECNAGASGDGKCKSCNSGYIGGNCDISLVALCLPSIIGCALLVIGLYFLAQFFIKRTKLKAALFNNDWIVNWSNFKRHDDVTGRSSMFLSALSMNNNNSKRKQVNTGIWEGIDVHYQKLDKGSLSLSDSIRLEVKQMRDMRHINIAQFVGCCTEAPNVCVLTELQPKGSLDDILTNEDIKMPWNFRFALLKGVCSGLEYLHKSEIRSHGRLKSSNILIDNRWTVKLSGFGLNELKSGQKNVGELNPHAPGNVDKSKANYGSLLWTAPELLRTGAYHNDHIGRGTVDGDIYSLGMIMSEMCTRDFPFADVMLEKEDIVGLMLGGKDESVLKVWNDYLAKLNVEIGGWIRPCIKDKEWPSKYEKRKALKKLMESAWHEDPVHRPTVVQIKNELERIDPQRGELMDHLVGMLEKYSSNLEDIVTKRTKQLQKEKQKTEDLVSRLLPKSVAEDLKQGKRVEPVSYEFVTIYFSDIVGFTAIAKASTPLEVVGLLNDMYTTFDSIAANYDVYKVETIGDAYMIVSGLPTKNGDKHAGEICTTAMDLMCAIGDFEIAHMKDTKLSLRSGVHTGNVVAGVVGLKMPRYCLFGESVNVASKMESGGKPQRIHISEDTYTILCRLGGYHCDYRHEVDVKGRGLIKTYWLNGKDGYTKKLPTPIDED